MQNCFESKSEILFINNKSTENDNYSISFNCQLHTLFKILYYEEGIVKWIRNHYCPQGTYTKNNYISSPEVVFWN